MRNECLDSMVGLEHCLGRVDFDNLPGLDAQLKMAPEHRHEEIRCLGIGKNAVHSSVLILLYPDNAGNPSLVFIQRPVYDGAHSGQISLPGGRFETGDKSFLHTALRETSEEIGVLVCENDVLGQFTPLYISPSNYIVFPYLALIHEKPVFRPDPAEVERVIEIGLDELVNPDCCITKRIPMREGNHLMAPCYFIDGQVIWGATAMIIAEFISLL